MYSAEIKAATPNMVTDLTHWFRKLKHSSLPYLPQESFDQDHAYIGMRQSLWELFCAAITKDGSTNFAGLICWDQHEVHQLFVNDDYRGLGIGRNLLVLPMSHSSKLIVWTPEINVEAIVFYEKQGFRYVGQDKHRYGNDITGIKLEWNK